MAVSLLPPNATDLERAAEAALAAIYELPVTIDRSWSPADCPEILLPWLAWALSVDQWEDGWPASRKRAVIAAAADVHRHKGTVGALRRALEALDMDRVEAVEWWAVGGLPYTFTVEATRVGRGISRDDITQIVTAIEATKNARSHLAALRFTLTQRYAAPCLAAAVSSSSKTTVRPPPAEISPALAASYLAGGLTSFVSTTIYPGGAL